MTKKQPHILIVDDQQDILEVLSAIFTKQGCDVTVTQNGFSALEALHKQTFDLILTDYNMPMLNGIDLIQLIFEQAPESRIVLMTAHDSKKLRELVKQFNMFDYITKPFPLDTLKRIVNNVVEQIQKAKPTPHTNNAYEQLNTHIHHLRMNTQAYAVILLKAEGHLIMIDGNTNDLDITAISALVAANFMAMAQVSQLLGNNSVFRSSYYEGPTYDIYAYSVDKNHLIATILGEQSKAGIARLYTKKTAETIEPLLHQALVPTQKIDTQFSQSVDKELQELFKVKSGI